MKHRLLIFSLTLSLILLGIGGWKFYQYWNENDQSDTLYSSLEIYVKYPDKQPESTLPEEDESTSEIPETDAPWPEVDFASLQQANPKGQSQYCGLALQRRHPYQLSGCPRD